MNSIISQFTKLSVVVINCILVRLIRIIKANTRYKEHVSEIKFQIANQDWNIPKHFFLENNINFYARK